MQIVDTHFPLGDNIKLISFGKKIEINEFLLNEKYQREKISSFIGNLRLCGHVQRNVRLYGRKFFRDDRTQLYRYQYSF